MADDNVCEKMIQKSGSDKSTFFGDPIPFAGILENFVVSLIVFIISLLVLVMLRKRSWKLIEKAIKGGDITQAMSKWTQLFFSFTSNISFFGERGKLYLIVIGRLRYW